MKGNSVEEVAPYLHAQLLDSEDTHLTGLTALVPPQSQNSVVMLGNVECLLLVMITVVPFTQRTTCWYYISL